MHVRKSSGAAWRGRASDGHGTLDLGRGELSAPFNLAGRVGEQPATTPEELLGSALAGCFAMSLADLCESHDAPAESVDAKATVHLVQTEDGFRIPHVDLSCVAHVPGMTADEVRELAEQAQSTCPVRVLYNAEVRFEIEVAE